MSSKPNDDDKDIEQIEASLAATHEPMIVTINELAAQLNPSVLAEDAEEQVKTRASHAIGVVKGIVSDTKWGG